jgi:hypothetical protein
LIQTAKLNDIKPIVWSTDMLQRVVLGRRSVHGDALARQHLHLPVKRHQSQNLLMVKWVIRASVGIAPSIGRAWAAATTTLSAQ